MKRSIYLFTETFPYGSGETFLMNEIKYLANNFERVYIIPLQTGEEVRKTPENVEIFDPLISFDTKKNRLKLIAFGIFNLSPCQFAFTEWRLNKPYKNKKRVWAFFTFLLRFRIIYKSLNISPKKDDIIYFYWGDKSVMLAPILKRKYMSNIVVRFHNSDLYEEIKIGYIPFRHYVFSAIDKFVPISENGCQYLLNKYPQYVKKKKIFVSRLGVFDCGISKTQSTNSYCFHIISCSYLVEIKRIDIIIKALRLIDFKVKWTHIGDGPLRTSLQSMCHTLPENVEVIWVGQKTNEEVIRFYQENFLDLFINVSSSEGIPVSIMEAMSFGIPAMATDVGGVSELVDNSNGVLLPAELDEKFLAASIRDFAQNKNFNLREKARENWERDFNADKNYRNFIRLLSENK